MDICIYIERERFSCFVNTQKKEHKRAKDNKEIYSDTRQERLNKERKKMKSIGAFK